ncbi:hypothetical protein ACFC63_14110 [Streptomyces albidoflavus]
MTPTRQVARADSVRPASLGTQASEAAARRTFSRVPRAPRETRETRGSSPRARETRETRETADRETPASLATS